MEKVAMKPNLRNDSPANLSTTKASYRPHMPISASDLATGTTSPDSPMATSAPKKEIAINESKKTSRCEWWLLNKWYALISILLIDLVVL